MTKSLIEKIKELKVVHKGNYKGYNAKADRKVTETVDKVLILINEAKGELQKRASKGSISQCLVCISEIDKIIGNPTQNCPHCDTKMVRKMKPVSEIIGNQPKKGDGD